MALGRRKDCRQEEMWVARAELPKSDGHVFYRKLNELLAEAGFDRFVEDLCRKHYHKKMGRPGIPPGVYFRMLLVGYFEPTFPRLLEPGTDPSSEWTPV